MPDGKDLACFVAWLQGAYRATKPEQSERSRGGIAVLGGHGWLMALGALTVCVLVGVARADAAVTHHYIPGLSSTFSEGVPAEGPKGEPVTLPGPLSGVSAMTVHEGLLWIAEKLEGTGVSRVDAFDAKTGHFEGPQITESEAVSGFGRVVAVGGSGENQNVFLSGQSSEGGVVATFSLSGALNALWAGAGTPNGSFTRSAGQPVASITGVAVDNSSFLGDVDSGAAYVATSSGEVPGYNVIDVMRPGPKGQEPASVIGQITGTCAAPGTCAGEAVPFSGPASVAVSGFNGDVLVADACQEGKCPVDLFEPVAGIEGAYNFVAVLPGTKEGAQSRVTGLAVDGSTGDIYVSRSGLGVEEFDVSGKFVGNIAGTPAGRFAAVRGVAVDSATGDVYVGNVPVVLEPGEVDVFGPNLVLPDVTTLPATEVAPESATLNGAVNALASGVASCRFSWGTTRALGRTVSCVPATLTGSAPEAVTVPLPRLEPDTRYFYRVEAENANGVNVDEEELDFKTPGPGLRYEAATDVSATAATIVAAVDPDGRPTSSYVEYGEETSYGRQNPESPGASVGSGEGAVEARLHLQHLNSATQYHYRVVLLSELEPGVQVRFNGPDQTFRTDAVEGAGLPDGRRWEMVSPADKHGATMGGISEGEVIQASEDGTALTYVTTLPLDESAEGQFEGTQVIARRGPSGWSHEGLSLPHVSATPASLGHGHEYRFFSRNLDSGLVEPEGEFTSLTPHASPSDTEATPYLRQDSTCTTSPVTCYVPLATAASGFEDVPPGTVFGEKVHFVGAAPDLSGVVVASQVPLTESPIAGGQFPLYEWSRAAPPTAHFSPVSLLPAAEGGALVEGQLGFQGIEMRGAVSEDGGRVFWTAVSGTAHLYMRDLKDQETIALDTVHGGSGVGPVSPHFQYASSNGEAVFFTDEQQLTPDSRANAGHPDLFRCTIVADAEGDACHLSDLTPAVGEVPSDVQGSVLSVSEDRYAYFVATSVLTRTPNSRGETAKEGEFNLYVRDLSAAAAPVLVAVLSSDDAPDWGGGQVHGQAVQTARSAGQWLAFMSDRSLTGYDNHDVTSGEPDEEVYLYNVGENALRCASCDPHNARPVGAEAQTVENKLVGGVRVWPKTRWLAANIPAWTPFESDVAEYQSRYLSSRGRLFFNALGGLASEDINNNWDVYEFEPASLGSCTEESVSFRVSQRGCVALLSSGRGADETAFLDASADGADVFFVTSESLSRADTDTGFDIYDARICPSVCESEPSPPPPCNDADACRIAATPQPPIFGAPASQTSHTGGNLKPGAPAARLKSRLSNAARLKKALKACRKQKPKRKRTTCERKARQRFRLAASHTATLRARTVR